ncbi:MAG: recombinase family protein [Candidatus Kaelpia imicola]|nr:recombinase family protein [Candidatus Kaelpia imicola]
MKIAVYTRVSTEDQAREGTSLEVQREFLVNYAKRESYDVYNVYVDDGYSGYTLERPALKKLLRDVNLKKFDMVLVYKIDRFARNNRLMLNLVEDLDNKGIGFKSATESFDTVSAAGKMALSMLGTVAQFERDRIIERVFPGMIKGVERGNWQGARYSPYGYHYNKEKKLLEVVPEEADIVKMMYLMYLSGQSTPQIAGYLYNKRYKTRSGGRFQTKLVGNILKNQIYLGKLVWNVHHYDKTKKTLRGNRYMKNDASKIVVSKGKHEAIICQEDFDAVQKKLEQNRKGIASRKGSKEYPLSGILVCAECGHKFRGCLSVASREGRKVKTKRRYYRCCGRSVHYTECSNGYVRADDIENVVCAIIETIFAEDIDEARLRGIINDSESSCDEDVKEKIADIKAKLSINLSKQERLGKVFSENLLAMEAFKNQILPLREEEKELKLKIKKLEFSLIEREKSKEYRKLLQTVIDHFDAIKSGLDIAGKKGLLRLVFKSITVENRRIKKFELYQPFKGLYKGEDIKCQLTENKRVAIIPESVSTCGLSAAR